MGKFNKLQSNFKMGEIGPRSLAQVDTEGYFKSCTQVTNFIPLTNGGVGKRGGTEYVVDLADDFGGGVDHSGAALIPFVISEDLAFVLIIKPNGTSSNWISAVKNDGT